MKKIIRIIFILFSVICFAQGEEIIKERGNLSNPKGNIYKSLEVIDQREDKKIGEMPFGDDKKVREIVFPVTANAFLSKWYTDSNHKGGKHELILVLKKLKTTIGETSSKETEADVEFSAQTFLKEGDRYSFLYKKDTVYSFKSKNISDVVVKNIPVVFAMFMKKTFTKKADDKFVTSDALADYESYVKSNSEAYTSSQLKDGIYLDHQSFLHQAPLQGKYIFERNGKGDVTKAIKDENGKKDKISAHEMFAYIENGKIYKHTFSGFMEVFKNEKGFYLMSNRGNILPVKPSSFSVGVGGVYNGIAIGLVSVIDRSIIQNKMKRDEIMEIYIDPLTGEYDFSDE
ncbi:hypothetical protein [Chryseobacterium sp. 3008163]|uniref:hypothetical protein n=1 Tax=Chryseobacterium sp. 3008163 TaxID=2478663 RepID=UPI000F0CB62A|nr:hypothetical protein [Chryseobacterium sp. 3008163]AYN00817.1 hypothetical protein EAG08_11275 [Chryseobacterium sp. 3008163]